MGLTLLLKTRGHHRKVAPNLLSNYIYSLYRTTCDCSRCFFKYYYNKIQILRHNILQPHTLFHQYKSNDTFDQIPHLHKSEDSNDRKRCIVA